MPVLTGVERLVALSLCLQLCSAAAATQLPALRAEPARAVPVARVEPPAASPSTTATPSPALTTTPAAPVAAPVPARTTSPPRPRTPVPVRSSPRAPQPAAVAPPPPTTAAPPTPAHDPAAYSAAVLAAVNDERRARGLPALAHDACADRYADEQAARMAARGAMGHQSLEPVLAACGTTRAAENVGQGDVSAQRMVAAWMASDGHRRTILDPALTAVGTGAARGTDGRWYACQVFVAR